MSESTGNAHTAYAFTDLVDLARHEDPAFARVTTQECIGTARAYLNEGRARVRERHDAGDSGSTVVRLLSELADELLRGAFQFGLYHVPNRRSLMARVSLCAYGGYGRMQLSPHSDIDVCLLYEGRIDSNVERLNDFLVPFLWDIGFASGYTLRSVREAFELARSDTKMLTSFLEGRLVSGDPTPFARLKLLVYELRPKDLANVFAELKERQGLQRRDDQDVYAPTPNVKESPGGLRDYHTALWLFQMAYGTHSLEEILDQGFITADESLDVAEGIDFIWRVRNELHFHAGMCEDRLTFENQRHVANAFGYRSSAQENVERFMQDYYAAAHKLRHLLRIAARETHIGASTDVAEARPRDPDFFVRDGELHAGTHDPNWFAENPSRLMSVFWECARRGVTVSRVTERRIRENLALVNDTFRSNDLVRRYFIALCNRPTHAGAALRQISQTGLLGAYLPEFAAIEGIIRYEDFHHYPVDEHTIRAIEALAELGPLDEPVMRCLHQSLEHLPDPYVLVLAILFHDLGKVSGESHVREGVEIAKSIGQRIGLTDDDIERVSFLVEHHMLMSTIGLYRDTDDPETVRHFANTMQTDERLRALFLLTYADMKAVAPNVWNEWKGALLLKLYLRSEKILLGRAEAVDEEFWNHPKAEEARAHVDPDLRDGAIDHIRGLGERYLMAFMPDQIAAHVRCVHEAATSGLAIHGVPHAAADTTEVVVCTRDHYGVFSEIAGSFASQLIDVRSAALFTRPDGITVDCFTVADATQLRPLTDAQFEAFERVLRAVLLEKAPIGEYVELAKRRLFALLQPHVPVRTRIAFDNQSSGTHTVIDLETGDRTGLLYDIARAMTGLGLDIASARIVTDARRVRDSFYVTLNDDKIGADMEEAVRATLHAAIHPRPVTEAKGGSE